MKLYLDYFDLLAGGCLAFFTVIFQFFCNTARSGCYQRLMTRWLVGFYNSFLICRSLANQIGVPVAVEEGAGRLVLRVLLYEGCA